MTLSNEDRQNLINLHLTKADESLSDAKILIENNRLFSSINRIYYSIFYSLSALAIKYEFSTSKHSQLIGWFNKNFIKENIIRKEIGKIIREAFEKRMKGDYDALTSFTKIEVEDLFEKIKIAIFEIRKLI